MDSSFGEDANVAFKQNQSQSDAGCGDDGCNPKPKPVSMDCCGTCWPVIIFVIFAIIVLIGILLTPKYDGNTKAWSFFVALIIFIIWALILWAFCRSGNHAIAWFLLLLPIAIAIFWLLSLFLAGATTSGNCVNGKPLQGGSGEHSKGL